MVEAALKEFTGEWEYERVKYACDRFAQWYKGDGWYGDGADFHLDYYNSFVIHPMMVEVLAVMKSMAWKELFLMIWSLVVMRVMQNNRKD